MSDHNKDDDRTSFVTALIFFVCITTIGIWALWSVAMKIEQFFDDHISVTIEYAPEEPGETQE